jgi:hypothetical protein
MGSDNQWTALGPAPVGFQTNSASIDRGAEISGNSLGILGRCNRGNGVHGQSDSATDSGVWGENTGAGFGVAGSSVTGEGVLGDGRNGVHGRSSSATDSGVWGENNGPPLLGGPSGVGVAGSSVGGYGGQFTGGFAQLYLTPSASTGHPTGDTHKKGEFYVDSNGSLFFCNADGLPGTWVKLA